MLMEYSLAITKTFTELRTLMCDKVCLNMTFSFNPFATLV